MEKFDILFLCHEKDKKILKRSLEYTKKNIKGYRKIFIVSKENYFPKDSDVIFVNENKFPFSKKDISNYVHPERAGWYFQQFLKMYFFKIMKKKVLNNLLIIDADTMFIKKTMFFEDGKPCYNTDKGYHQPYYAIIEKIFGFGKQSEKISGITHHMLFQRRYIEEILKVGSKNGKIEFWKNILRNINKDTLSGFSEYDLYLNYMLRNYPERIKVRKLRFINFPYYGITWVWFFRKLGYNYLSAHDYLIEDKFSAPKRLVIEFLTYIGVKRPLKEGLMKLGILKQV